jgi:von Willebrand factor type A domain
MTSLLMRACLAALVVALASVPPSAQSREHAMYVSVLDRDGKPVMDLKPDEFVIRENGARREVLRASRATTPLDVAVIVDNSQAATPFTNDLREAMRTFVRALGGTNRMALIGAAERPTVLQDYSTDPAALMKGVDRVFAQPGSGAYVLQAIIEVSNGMQKREPPRPVIVVVATDGPEFSDRMHDLDLSSDEARERAIVFDRGTRDSGGRYDNVLASQALPAKLTQVAEELKNQYIVTYSRPEALIRPDTFEVTSSRPGLTVRGIPVKTGGGAR